MFDDVKGLDLRVGSPITAYVGPNGSGKSLLAVTDVLAALDAGRQVVSTVRLLDPDSDELCQDDSCDWPGHPDHRAAHPLWVPLRTWDDLLQAEHCDVLLDEVTGVVSSRESSSLPAPIADMLVQLRRRDVRLRWTAPAWARADLLLREVTQSVILTHSLLRRKVPGESWRATTWLRWKMVDARDLDELTQAQRLGTAQNPVPRIGRGIIKVEKLRGRLAYNTLDAVASLSGRVRRGSCLSCGGSIRQPACSC